MGIPVIGTISGIQGIILLDQQSPARSDFQIILNSGTINTRSKARDKRIRKDDFLGVLTYPEIKFKSTKVSANPVSSEFQMQRILTIKGISKPIEFPFQVRKANGSYRFTGGFNINRLDFSVGESSWILSSNVVAKLNIFATN